MLHTQGIKWALIHSVDLKYRLAKSSNMPEDPDKKNPEVEFL